MERGGQTGTSLLKVVDGAHAAHPHPLRPPKPSAASDDMMEARSSPPGFFFELMELRFRLLVCPLASRFERHSKCGWLGSAWPAQPP
jgi:hypothetical protein